MIWGESYALAAGQAGLTMHSFFYYYPHLSIHQKQNIGKDKSSRKPRRCTLAPYGSTKALNQRKKDKNAPKTSAQATKMSKQSNLTLTDWLTIVAFSNKHSEMNHGQIIAHFASLTSGALVFSQPSLSYHLSKESREQDLI